MDYKKKYKFISYTLLLTISLIFVSNTIASQIDIAKKKYDLEPIELKEVLDWININTDINSHFMSIDSNIVTKIPTLTGRYNYIPSLKTITPTDISEVIFALQNTKKFLKLNDDFYNFLDRSCREVDYTSKENRICEYLFHGYFKLDEGSYHYHKLKNVIPDEIKLPDKNRLGNKISNLYIDLSKDVNINYLKKEPDYVILGPVEKKYMLETLDLNNFKLVFSTANYDIFLKNKKNQF